MHPEGDPKDPLLDTIATMTADDAWVPAHALIAVGTVVMAVGLWQALGSRTWPAALGRALRLCAIALSLYSVETVFHLATVVDSDALAAGGTAPIAWAHLSLAFVLYPLSGAALVWLGVQLHRTLSGPERLFGGIAVIAGTLHATAYLATLAVPDLETAPMFAGAGMLIAGWGLGVGVAGLRSAVDRSTTQAPVPVLAG